MKQIFAANLKEGERVSCSLVYVRCYGIKRRARSNQHHRIDVGLFIDINKDELETRCKELVNEHMKRLVTSQVELVIQQHEVGIERGLKIERSSSDWIYGATKQHIDIGGMLCNTSN